MVVKKLKTKEEEIPAQESSETPAETVIVNEAEEEAIILKEPTTEEVTEKSDIAPLARAEELGNSSEAVTFTPDVAVKPAIRNVKIKMAQNHSCSIGGVFYHLEKDKQYNVPENVKAVLVRAGLLQPLD